MFLPFWVQRDGMLDIDAGAAGGTIDAPAATDAAQLLAAYASGLHRCGPPLRCVCGGVSLAGDGGREKRNRCGPEVSGADRYGVRGAVVRGALYGVHKCLPKIALPTRVRLIGVMLLLPADQAIPACGCDCLLQEQAEASEGLCSVSS